MRKLLLVCVALLTAQVQAQDNQGRVMLEAGITGGKSPACPGSYVGVAGQIAGPVSLYGMVEHYRCIDLIGSANRIGASIRLGDTNLFVRPALRAGLEYDSGNISPTVAGTVTIGRRYGARLILHVGDFTGETTIVLFQIGGYISFGS